LQTRHGPDSVAKQTPAHRPFWAIFQKYERRGEVFLEPIEAGGRAKRRDEARLPCRNLGSYAQWACGTLCQSASPAWITYSRPSTS
jgi:hypothetical protein